MNGTGHVLVNVRKFAGGTWSAVCVCGHEVSSRDRSLAVAGLYKHTIDAARPPCPTPHKTRYGTEAEALAAISKFLRRTANGLRPTRTYQCPSGQHWHTTKHPARKNAS
ncbi:hypothetical protein [Nocardia ignorata]|uniref:Uncharacterized protein n=1 Tax=Nocardia ignorata TaxID=145285 RepID=A0A4R6NZS9_NOCIG|nr:hypothetical protein [Nocardia ignorata]TDP29817.1 hypothetical protein DFR75_11285 [Nocardia ignorata]